MPSKQPLIDRIIAKCIHIAKYRAVNLANLHSWWEQDHLRRLLLHFDVDCVFDVGANYGQYAQMLRRKAKFKGLIISFEPIPEAAAHLRRLSVDDPKWVIEECALSNREGKQSFNVMAESQFSSLSEPIHSEVGIFRELNKVSKRVEVRSETLDSAFERLKLAYKFERPFLKMDTQGHDIEVVRHGTAVIDKIVGIQSELAIKRIYENSEDLQSAISFYEQCGFTLSAFVPNNGGHFPLLVETDCIMVRSDLLAQESLNATSNDRADVLA